MTTTKPITPYAVISIADSGNTKLISEILAELVNDDPLHVGTLYQEFDNIESPYKQKTLFTVEQGRDILDFVDKVSSTVSALYIHCHAGGSRSNAVASALELRLGNKEDSDQYWKSNTCFPNSFVYKTLTEISGLYDEQELDRLMKMSLRAVDSWTSLFTEEEV